MLSSVKKVWKKLPKNIPKVPKKFQKSSKNFQRSSKKVPNKFLKGHKSLRMLFEGENKATQSVSQLKKKRVKTFSFE